MLDWFRRHVAAQKILLYLSVVAVSWYFVRDVRTTAFFTLAFVLNDDWIFTLLPAGWDRRRARGVVKWMLIGLLVGFGVVSPLWFAWFPLGVAVIVAVVDRADLRLAIDVGVPLGLAMITGFLAWTNRLGPGEVCRSYGADQECTRYIDPRPWALAAVALTLAAVVVQIRRVRRLRVQTEVAAPG